MVVGDVGVKIAVSTSEGGPTSPQNPVSVVSLCSLGWEGGGGSGGALSLPGFHVVWDGAALGEALEALVGVVEEHPVLGLEVRLRHVGCLKKQRQKAGSYGML